MLKRKEREFEQEIQRLAQAKIKAQDHITCLKKDLVEMNVEVDLKNFIKDKEDDDQSDSTATGMYSTFRYYSTFK